MANDRRPVDDCAAAILDGASVNWDALEATSQAVDRALIPHLRLVARIAQAHRSETARDAGHPSRPAPLETWGHLDVLERVGSGAFGEVYRAWDRRLDRHVALKLLDKGETPGDGSTVIAEGSLLARVRHPNVVTVHGAERLDGRVGVWMEFIEGKGLDALIRDQGPFSAHEAAIVGMTICRALAAVHGVGLLHRDIKAQNVMREGGGRIVLMDFGTGLLLERSAGADGGLAGTPLYLAPELFAGAPASVQSDVYAVGVLLFHLVTSSFPVTGDTLSALREAHQERRRRFLRDERPDLADEFVTVVEKAIAADPGRRFQTAGVMEAALGGAVGAHDGRLLLRPRAWAAASLAALVAAAAFTVAGRTRGGRAHQSATGVGASALEALIAPSTDSSVVVRKIPVPPGYLVGRPSTDGRWVSFSDAGGNVALYEIATGDARTLTTAATESGEHAMYTVISGDSRWVAYSWRALDGKSEMRVVGTDGRRPRVILRQDGVDEPIPLAWSPDGASVLSILHRSEGTNLLAFVSLDGRSVRAVRELGSDRPRHVSLSPDGRSIVYDLPQEPTGARDLFLIGADGSDDRPLITHPANDNAPAWTPDGEHVVFASDRSGTMDLWSIAVADGEPRGQPAVVHRGVGRMSPLGLTEKGSYFFQSIVGAVEVYTADVDPAGQVRDAAPLAPEYSGSNISSIWSPDGRHVAYASRRGMAGFDRGSATLVLRDVASGEHREVTPATLNTFLVRWWSPDMRQIVVNATDAAGRSGLFSVDVGSGATDRLSLGDRPRVQQKGEPATGKFLYLKDGALRVRDFEAGTDTVAVDFVEEGVVAGDVGGSPCCRLAPDGVTVAFSGVIEEGGSRLRSLRVKSPGTASRELFRDEGQLVVQDWTPDGTAVLFTRRPAGQPVALWQVPSDGGDASAMGLAIQALRDVRIHPGGRRITFTAGQPALEVWAIENLPSRLEQP